VLQSEGLRQTRDFEKVSARRLKPSEFSVNAELGFVSLNVNVLPDQVIGVAYTYSYNGRTYKVGELSNNSEITQTAKNISNPNNPQTQVDTTLNVLYVKMLKSTTQRTDVPTWQLMMKNIYSIGAFQVNPADFRLDIYYDDPGKGYKRFLPESNLSGEPLLRVFNADVLNTQGDPQPDGIFDFVPGLTINTRNGRVMLPVLEPFGSSLGRKIDNKIFRDKYTYQQLYDSTLFIAQEFQEKNRFVIKGTYKSSVSSEISLGAFNIPRGSVRVSAGGQTLLEGRDFEIDYNIGRVRILNDAILASGVPVNVSFEDNTLFGFQQKSLFGLRADYQIDKNFNIGATMMRLFERPFTQKVNIGDDPINNSIYGVDMNINKPAPWITKLVDAIPGISTKANSSINFTGEAAMLRPGHSRAINQNRADKGGVVYIDDFEGTSNSFDLRQPVANWYLASVPQNQTDVGLFPESKLVDSLDYGVNRAKLSWYRIDQTVRNTVDTKNPYTSFVPQIEVFPNVQLQPQDLPNIPTFDLSYNPLARGPYNFDKPQGTAFSAGVRAEGDSLRLLKPEERWGGIMRALTTNDFQAANIEFLEFWMLHWYSIRK
jgi:cell surface protein SprA